VSRPRPENCRGLDLGKLARRPYSSASHRSVILVRSHKSLASPKFLGVFTAVALDGTVSKDTDTVS
jgi:hypothetical protein